MARLRGVAASGSAEVTQTAVDILEAGGNAFDAVLGALCTAAIAEPLLASLGGGGHVDGVDLDDLVHVGQVEDQPALYGHRARGQPAGHAAQQQHAAGWGGGGLVADSEEEAEYRESLAKIQRLMEALG